MMDDMDQTRARPLKEGNPAAGPVLYWMSRDQRAADNWALHFAQETALERRVPLAVVFCLLPAFGEATARQYRFMLRGLAETAKCLRGFGIPFFLLEGSPPKTLPEFITEQGIGILITDFSPLRIRTEWVCILQSRTSLPFWEVDAHNIVPVWQASDHQEWSARTFRPKIGRLLSRYLVPFPSLRKHPYPWKGKASILDFDAIGKRLPGDRSVREIDHLSPGSNAARDTLHCFLSNRLERYAQQHNDPNAEVQSGLSSYLHFGQISPARVALEVLKQPESSGREDFIDQLIVRRELAENFCHWNPDYDAWAGFPAWGRRELDSHRADIRPKIYSEEELELSLTVDPLWNAAQTEMVCRGTMPGYLRMYWAKKLLEWTVEPEEAHRIAIRFNDRYLLDGRDPNGYAGIAWSLAGLHDRPWNQRPVFGHIRWMSLAGAARKFDLPAYIARVRSICQTSG
jgi:deoxyribodipyrimidine photo-lyase